MTEIFVTCAYCNQDATLTADQIIIQMDGPRSTEGTYRWFHDCNGGPIVKKANFRIINVLLAAGCEVEYTGDEAIVAGFRRFLDTVQPQDFASV